MVPISQDRSCRSLQRAYINILSSYHFHTLSSSIVWYVGFSLDLDFGPEECTVGNHWQSTLHTGKCHQKLLDPRVDAKQRHWEENSNRTPGISWYCPGNMGNEELDHRDCAGDGRNHWNRHKLFKIPLAEVHRQQPWLYSPFLEGYGQVKDVLWPWFWCLLATLNTAHYCC